MVKPPLKKMADGCYYRASLSAQEHDITDAITPRRPSASSPDHSPNEVEEFDFSNFHFMPSAAELQYSIYHTGDNLCDSRHEHLAEDRQGLMPSQASLYQISPGSSMTSSEVELETRFSVPRVPVGSKNASGRQISQERSSEAPRSSMADGEHTPGLSYERSGAQRMPGVDIGTPEVKYDEWKHEETRRGSTDYSMHYGADNDRNALFPSGCAAQHDIHQRRTSWLSMSILILSIYSTIFSGIWLILGAVQPRYGRIIQNGGSHLNPSSASILFAAFAKTIELSFVTVFVAFLGQVLSRRSLMNAARGVTIAEMSMRTWVIQPGFMITNWETLRYTARTFLGITALIATIVAMLYTTASDALVSPHLKFGKAEDMTLLGMVNNSYGNITFVKHTCQGPVPVALDPVYKGDTCLELEHAGQAYHNYNSFLGNWTTINANGTGRGISTNLAERPQISGMIFDNTTVTGQWVETHSSDVPANYEKYKRIINNVTMSFPHANVLAAARDPKNRKQVIQPEELEGLGKYDVIASVVSPTINVMCVDMMQSELDPLIYINWQNSTTATMDSNPNQTTAAAPQYLIEMNNTRFDNIFLNSTSVDDIFEWGEKYERPPAAFPQYPIDYNAITDITAPLSDSIYLLLKAPATTNFTLCQLRSYLNPQCSTRYNVSGTTYASMEAHCEDPHDSLSYIKSNPSARSDRISGFRDILTGWSFSLSLNTGITNGNASINRQLTQFILSKPILNATMPSLAEALAALSGCTLLLSATSASFDQSWNNITSYQPFSASVSSQQYSSGPQVAWQNAFYIILVFVFAFNIVCFCHLAAKSGTVTDFTEPQNLFAVAVNSPASGMLSGACGAGPMGRQLQVGWKVRCREGGKHFYVEWDGVAPKGKGSGNMVYLHGDGAGTGTPGGGSNNVELRSRSSFRPDLTERKATSYGMLKEQRESWIL